MSDPNVMPNVTEISERAKALLGVRTQTIGFAIDWCKHLATLATGTIVVSSAFIKDLLNGREVGHKWLVILAWGFLVLSLIVSSLVYGALIAVMNDAKFVQEINVFSKPASGLAMIQSFSLVVGLILFVVFVSLNFS
jgi:hypothetical protein